MAAWHKLPQVANSGKSPISKGGVLTIQGFGVRVRMQAGHLEVEDGIANERRRVRLARVGHGLRRLVCIAEDGFFTIDALKWLADQRASLIMLDRSGKVSLVIGPTAPSDARLRRAQALAGRTGAALEIMRELMREKLDGQEQLLRSKLANAAAADMIAKLKESLSTAENLDTVAHLESQAASVYWSAWSELPINFPRQDVPRVAEHWRKFGTRKSVLSGSPRLATNPPNAILNYCYALLESETRLAAAAVGLDPGLGMLHVDTPARDSLACDIMEAVRPSIDAWLLDWITREPFRRSDFFEERNGNCRLLKTLTIKLSETMSVWGKLVAPWAEYVARTLWVRTRTRGGDPVPTRLTQRHRREAKGSLPAPIAMPKTQSVCRDCGVALGSNQTGHCMPCKDKISRSNMIETARLGRIASKSPQARARLAASQKRQNATRRGWLSSSLPAWLTQTTYRETILPRLAEVTVLTLANTLHVTEPYAATVRKGQNVPHPMHWQALAKLVGVSNPG